MRIRRSFLAPIVLALGTAGAVLASPVLTVTAAVPASAAVASGHVTPASMYYHG